MMTNIPTRRVFPEIDNVEMKVKMLAKKSGNYRSSTCQVVATC
jgi:hypothetical protein